MAVLLENGPAPVATAVLVGEGPLLRDVVSRSLSSLMIAVMVPGALFWATLVLTNVFAAVIVALAWMTATICWRWAAGRSVPRLLLLTFAIMAVRTCFTLITGNAFVYFVQPVFADATVAAVFLGSLLTTRPLVARLAPDFYPIDAALNARPGIQRLFRRLTLLWGLVVVTKGTTTLWLLLSQSTVDFVLFKTAAIIGVTLLGVAVTITLSAITGRQEGLLGNPQGGQTFGTRSGR
jgi:intracellular septation protein A